MEHGAWSMEHGAWSMEHGAWSMEHGAWSMEHGAWSMEHGAWSMEFQTGMKPQGITLFFFSYYKYHTHHSQFVIRIPAMLH
ncbi:hypothetical protein SK066_20155 [Paenibacillus hunanensis]|uniref:hypothetical protein n=1 Tax=Paenibacillus hunanensis TaxID=539262 RepID=UPI002A69CB86|nr:hypothetical protein [Paenibacillus hunanensis]WPP40852.1 hypothetical protein SK066_20155 [Paenibacillus hunanensis]